MLFPRRERDQKAKSSRCNNLEPMFGIPGALEDPWMFAAFCGTLRNFCGILAASVALAFFSVARTVFIAFPAIAFVADIVRETL